MTVRLRHRAAWLCSTTFLAVAMPGAAYAQQDRQALADDTTVSDLDIIVTANKRE